MKRKKKRFYHQKKKQFKKSSVKGGNLLERASLSVATSQSALLPQSLESTRDKSIAAFSSLSPSHVQELNSPSERPELVSHAFLSGLTQDLDCQNPTVDSVDYLNQLLSSKADIPTQFTAEFFCKLSVSIAQQQKASIVSGDDSPVYSSVQLQQLMDGIHSKFGESVACQCADTGLRTAFYQSSEFVQESLETYPSYNTQRVLRFIEQNNDLEGGLDIELAAQWINRAISSFFCVTHLDRENKATLIHSIVDPISSQLNGEVVLRSDGLDALNAKTELIQSYLNEGDLVEAKKQGIEVLDLVLNAEPFNVDIKQAIDANSELSYIKDIQKKIKNGDDVSLIQMVFLSNLVYAEAVGLIKTDQEFNHILEEMDFESIISMDDVDQFFSIELASTEYAGDKVLSGLTKIQGNIKNITGNEEAMRIIEKGGWNLNRSHSKLSLVKQIQSLDFGSPPIVLSYSNGGLSAERLDEVADEADQDVEAHIAGMVVSIEKDDSGQSFIIFRNLNSLYARYEEDFTGDSGDAVLEYRVPLLSDGPPFKDQSLDDIKTLFERFIVSDGVGVNGVRYALTGEDYEKDFKTSVENLALACLKKLPRADKETLGPPSQEMTDLDLLSKLKVPLEDSVVVPSQEGGSCTMYLMRIVSVILGTTSIMDKNLTHLVGVVDSLQDQVSTSLVIDPQDFFDAVEEGDDWMVDFLQKRIDCQDSDGNTALMTAVVNEEVSLVEKLLEFYADSTIPNENGDTVLMTAVSLLNQSCVETILDHSKESINLKDSDGDTALMMAVNNEDPIIVKQLLDFGADSMIPNKRGETPLDMAQKMGNAAIIDLLK